MDTPTINNAQALIDFLEGLLSQMEADKAEIEKIMEDLKQNEK